MTCSIEIVGWTGMAAFLTVLHAPVKGKDHAKWLDYLPDRANQL